MFLPVISLVDEAMAGSWHSYRDANGTVVFSDVRPGVNGTRQYRSLEKTGNRVVAQATRNPCRGYDAAGLERRAQPLMPIFERHAREYNVDPLLVKAIARVESCFDAQAVSRAGARGIMQLMPATAKQFGVTQLFDARQNIETGVRYFAELQKQFQHNATLALAAYNAGPNAVVKHQGIPPYKETQRYVRQVLEHYRNYTVASRQLARAD